MAEQMVEVLWPERRRVPASKVIGWAQDAWEDEKDAGDPPTVSAPVTLEAAMVLLEDLGKVTFKGLES